MTRRGAYAKKSILKGEKISLENSIFLRPTNVNDFLYIKKILSKKAKNKKIKNQIISK